ncbi:MAG TPA: ABC transporter substrate-binding protein [Casimicrobiaceae bacterium]|jgi:ABC-type transport system substrate-binding protein|nr:ABC transporter substrate-binding protein [Casimicrobiaceae bacterium]
MIAVRGRAVGWLVAAMLAGGVSPLLAADPAKVLHVALVRAETGFDPAQVNEVYSGAVIAAIMEPLLTFDYLARPVKLAPLTAQALPAVSDDGRRYTLNLRKGVYFASDPAFKGKRRELTAADYVYAIKRLVDPANRSPNAFYVEGKIAGLDALVAKAKQNGGRFDYNARVAGLETPDRYTLRITLTHSDYTFAQVLALPALSAVAREVVEAYPTDLAAHPVGTGPYVLKEWVRASRIVLEANPGFRETTWDFEPGDDPGDRAIAARMRGVKMPQVGTIEISVMEEPQSSWLAFKRGELDILNVPATFAPIALPHGKLAPDLVKQGVYLSRILLPAINYTAFNMRDPVIGGLANDRIALRRAITMAYDIDAEVNVIRKGQAQALSMPIPPGVAGYDPHYHGALKHDRGEANALLDRFGYRKGADGYRRLPDGKPLVLHYASQTDALAREFDELWQQAMDALRIRLVIDKGKFSDQIREAIACHHQMWSYGWIADYPDADNFMQLLYGGNVGQSNVACYKSPTYDALYEQSRLMPDSPARDRLYEQMTRQFEADTPWRLGTAPYQNSLVRARVVGYKAHPVLLADWIYVDIEPRKP